MVGKGGNEPGLDRSDPLDPGLANERTSLAWNRTGLALAALGVGLIRVAVDLGALAVAGYVLGGLVAAIAVCAWAYGYLGYQRTLRAPAGERRPLARSLALRVIAIATAIAGAGALVLALLGPGNS